MRTAGRPSGIGPFLVVAALLLLAPLSSSAQTPYFRLDPSDDASFETPSGSTLSRDVTVDETLVTGVVATRIENEETEIGGSSQTYWNYWTFADGQLFLHGFWRPVEEFGRVYDPPVLWIDADPTVGDAWQTQFQAFDFTTGDPTGQPRTDVAVTAAETIDVPAGSFEVLLFEYVDQRVAKSGFDLLGRRAGPARNTEPPIAITVFEWRSVTTGLVRSGTTLEPQEDWFELVGGTVDAAARSWGAVKEEFVD